MKRKAVVWLGVSLILAGSLLGCGGGAARLQEAQVLAQVEKVKGRDPGFASAAVQAVPAAPESARDYAVGPEDLLEIKVYGQKELDRQVRVNGEGEITVPLVGTVKVSGLSPKAIERRLSELYGAAYLRNPQISVAVREFRHQRVSVTGAVEKPGSYEIIGPRSLLEVLAMAGGLRDRETAKAGEVVHVIRQAGKAGNGGSEPLRETVVIDLKQLFRQGTPELNVEIRPGDVVHVPYAGNAYVLGGVRRPGHVPVRDNLSLSQAVALAGGVDPVLATPQVSILRLDENRRPQTITARLDRILRNQEEDVPLRENDVVVVNMGPMKKHLYVFKALLPGGAATGAYRYLP